MIFRKPLYLCPSSYRDRAIDANNTRCIRAVLFDPVEVFTRTRPLVAGDSCPQLESWELA